MKIGLQIIISIILIFIGYIEKSNLWESGYSQAGIITLLTFVVTFLVEHHKIFLFYIKTKALYRNKEIRISIAYLYRIKVDNTYLLVKSRTRNYYQPVGGCYKTLPGSEKIFEKLEVKPDRKFETEKGIAKNDLRVYVKGKNVIDFLEWFESKQDREISPWREFCEELIGEDILPWKQFRFIDYKFKGEVKSPLIELESGGKGLFIFDIYDLVINDEQKPILRELQKENSEKYIWVTDTVIQALGHDGNSKEYIHEIAPHAKYAQNLSWPKQ
jgi:hypothetical protein